MKKRKQGQPTKYRKEYPALLEGVLSEELFVETFCAMVGIHLDTFYEWLKVHKAFSESYKRGKAVSKSLFLTRMRDAAWDAKKTIANNGLVALLAVNVHGMVTGKEKVEVDKHTTEKKVFVVTKGRKSVKSSGK